MGKSRYQLKRLEVQLRENAGFLEKQRNYKDFVHIGNQGGQSRTDNAKLPYKQDIKDDIEDRSGHRKDLIEPVKALSRDPDRPDIA